jgi:signal transduction histidine kinase
MVLQAGLRASRASVAPDLRDELEASVSRFRAMVESLMRPPSCSSPSSFDLADLGRRVVDDLQRAANQQGRQIQLTTTEPLDVVQQEEAVRSILTNLLLNAITHGNQGLVQMQIRPLDTPPVDPQGAWRAAPPAAWLAPWRLVADGAPWVEIRSSNPASAALQPEHFLGRSTSGRSRLGLVTITGLTQALGGWTACSYEDGRVVLRVVLPRAARERREEAR